MVPPAFPATGPGEDAQRGFPSMLHRFLVAAAVAAMPAFAHASPITQLKNQPPDGAQNTYLLTDGTVLAQGYSNSDFWVLTPDKTGSYVNGTWKQVGSLQSGYSPSADASQVLADGRPVGGGDAVAGRVARLPVRAEPVRVQDAFEARADAFHGLP